ncbi:hypothetical protein THAOC_01726, partial [Thalassiosira oceanica]
STGRDERFCLRIGTLGPRCRDGGSGNDKLEDPGAESAERSWARLSDRGDNNAITPPAPAREDSRDGRQQPPTYVTS